MPALIGTPTLGSTGATPASSLTFSYTQASGTDRKLIVAVIAYAPTLAWGDPVTITYGGTALVKEGSSNVYGSYCLGFWVLANPVVGTANIAISMVAGQTGAIVAVARSFSGAHQTTPGTFASAFNNSGSSTAAAVTVNSSAGQQVVAALFATPVTTATPGATQTNDLTSGPNTDSTTMRGSSSYRSSEASAPNTTVSYTLNPGAFWEMAAITVPTAPAGDTTPPTVSSRAVNGATLTVTYDEALDPNFTPAASAFAVTVAGSPRAITNVVVSGPTVTLTLASPVASGQTVTLSYTP